MIFLKSQSQPCSFSSLSISLSSCQSEYPPFLGVIPLAQAAQAEKEKTCFSESL
jgi:hypothetical protein